MNRRKFLKGSLGLSLIPIALPRISSALEEVTPERMLDIMCDEESSPSLDEMKYILAEMEKVPVFLVVPVTATLVRLILNPKTSEEVRLHFMNSPWFSRICRDERVKQAVEHKVESGYKRDQMA